MFFKKFIIAIFIATSSLFLFVMIIRLGNNKKGLLGVSDLISYVETRDLSKPLKNFSNSIETLTTSWKDFLTHLIITLIIHLIVVVEIMVKHLINFKNFLIL